MIDKARRCTTVVEHKYGRTRITLLEFPGPEDWLEVKRRALISINKKPKTAPTNEWIADILEARHSPIRRAWYSFLIEDIPSNTATHYARHVHAQPYISTLRNDLQEMIDGDHAPRCTPVGMILDVNAEELQIICNKRLCNRAAQITRIIAKGIREVAVMATPQIAHCLIPMCEYCGGVCHEMKPCGKQEKRCKK